MQLKDEMNQYAKENHVPVMKEEGLQLLLNTLMENDCHSFLELGTAIARTAIVVASLREDMKVVTIERTPEMIKAARKNILESGYANRITLIEGDALEVETPKGPFDCIFIDAAKAQYQRFFTKYAKVLSPNGIIVSDNMNFHGLVQHPENTHNRNTKQLVRKIQKYHDFLHSLDSYTTEFYDLGDGVAITRRKQNEQ